MSALVLENITKSFKQGERKLEVLRGILLTIEPGEVVALTGTSGTGKSTLLQIAGLLDRPTSGEVHIGGVKAGDKDQARTELRRAKLGFVYQFHHLMPDFTALENIAIAARINGKAASQAMADAKAGLAAMGLAERANHLPAQLSGGEQQRVAIARALVNEPVVLLADEPTGNLDEATSGRVFELLLKTAKEQGVAAMVATHDQALAGQMDRRLALKDGMIAEV